MAALAAGCAPACTPRAGAVAPQREVRDARGGADRGEGIYGDPPGERSRIQAVRRAADQRGAIREVLTTTDDERLIAESGYDR